ncbi:MAG: phage holin family protein [Candidatus Microsaccharimonas sossegonensis]|uniref:Phage holin family protein n=1 Tax=Candidatus Microsaccharimonas sossegonensis TaxID=2506948 RepID=A0A4Q0AGP5_9BACT|nr:MAG: phage holin family protein [Candidatus Microsaccharimonas sossegonensis]
MKKHILIFVVRWVLNSFGLWIAFRLLGTGIQNVEVTAGMGGFLLAGLIFSIINSVFKPLAVILSLPAILLSLGLFVIIVNGVLVYVSIALTPGFSMSFLNSILTGIILSLINYIVSAAVEIRGGTSGAHYDH